MVGEYTRHMSRLPDSPRVLVVEDDAALSEVVCTFLGDEGYTCVSAFSGTFHALMSTDTPSCFRLSQAMSTPR